MNKSVLIIDGDAGMLRALEKVLAGEGLRVTSTSFVGEGIEILTRRKTPVDLVITELGMPPITGVTGLRLIRNNFPEVPVIVLTALAGTDFRVDCVRLGARFLEKPLNTVQLRAAIEEVFPLQRTGLRAQ